MRAVSPHSPTARSLTDYRPNGVRFTAYPGTSEFAKRWHPQRDDIVTFKHHGFLLGSKKPKLPTLFRLRHDLTWDTVLQNWKEDRHTPTGMNTLLRDSSVL